MALTSSMLVLALVLPGQAAGAEFAHNFRGGAMPPAERMALVGMDPMVEATPEEEGLRIKILPNRGKDGVGMQTQFPLTGDFEITASYEILSADKPTKGYGVGFNVSISPADWQKKRAGLARYWTVQKKSGFQPTMMMAGPEPVREFAWEDSETMKGQLRLRREGANLLYLINEDLGQPLREIFRCAYGTESVDAVRFVANPGTSPAALDVRLLDVRMLWGKLPEHAATAPALDVKNTTQAADGGGIHLWLLVLISLFLLGAGLLTFYLFQHRNVASGKAG
jgi:hypothetical protein